MGVRISWLMVARNSLLAWLRAPALNASISATALSRTEWAWASLSRVIRRASARDNSTTSRNTPICARFSVSVVRGSTPYLFSAMVAAPTMKQVQASVKIRASGSPARARATATAMMLISMTRIASTQIGMSVSRLMKGAANSSTTPTVTSPLSNWASGGARSARLRKLRLNSDGMITISGSR